MYKNILLTGATGFWGSELADQFLKQTKGNIYALVRANDKTHATMRLKAAWKDQPALYESIGKHVIPVPGDFNRPDRNQLHRLSGTRYGNRSLLSRKCTDLLYFTGRRNKSASEKKRIRLVFHR